MYVIYTTIIISISLSIIMLAFEKKGNNTGKFLSKTLASLFFVFSAFVALFLTERFEMVLLLIAEALVLCMVGDIFLCIEDIAKEVDVKIMRLVGMTLFLLGHFAFLLVFIFLVKGFNFWLLLIVPSLPLITIASDMLKVIKLDNIKLPVLLYSTVVGIVLAAAVNVVSQSINARGIIVLVAAILFLLSDASLLVYNYGSKRLFAFKASCIVLYYIAQCLFALSIIF